MSEGDVLSPGQQIKALIDVAQVRELLNTRYGFEAVTIVELDAYDDRNYRVLCKPQIRDNPHVSGIAKDGYVLKITNSFDSKDTRFIEARSELLVYLSLRRFVCPIPVKQKNGSYYSLETLENGQKHALRLLVYQQGETLGRVKLSTRLLYNLGEFAGRLNITLSGFSHPGYENRSSLWMLQAVPKLRDFIFALDNKDDATLVEQIIKEFETKVLPIYKTLPQGIIHGDLNESNVIASSGADTIGAIIDFGDSHRNCYVFELAVCLCYMLTKANDIAIVRHLVDGYRSIMLLAPEERSILKLCVCARFAQSLVLGCYSYQREPNNEYLIRDHPAKWSMLKRLWRMDNSSVMKIWNI